MYTALLQLINPKLSRSFLPLRFYQFELIVPNDIPIQIHTTNVFQLSQVCSYQEVLYIVTLQRVDVEGDAAIVVGPKIVQPYSMQRLAFVQETIHQGLVMNARYSVVMSVSTSGGMIMNTSSQLFVVGKYNVMNV